MTCIIGFVDKETGIVYMGCDSCASNRYHYSIMDTPKVFELKTEDAEEKLLFGYTSSFRFGQIIQHHLKLPKRSTCYCGNDLEYMITKFVPEVKGVLKEHGCATIKNNEEKGGFGLVAYRNKLYTLQDDYSVLEYTKPFASVGCGEDRAVAIFDFLYKFRNTFNTSVKKRTSEQIKHSLISILEAVTMSDCCVKGPFHILTLGE